MKPKSLYTSQWTRGFSQNASRFPKRMSDERFNRMRSILSAESPIGLEGAMTSGLIDPMARSFIPKSWRIHKFKGSSATVIDTRPDFDEDEKKRKNGLTVMFVGHADKIRMQVRRVEDNGKIYIDSDSFLPATLLGNVVTIFSEKRMKYHETKSSDERKAIAKSSAFTKVKGTVEALGAIHFADDSLRSGAKGVKKDDLYVDLNITGKDAKKRIEEELGIRTGDPILLDRPISRTVGANTFSGAYLDNGLGCFITTELARLVAEEEKNASSPFYNSNLRCLFAIATHEEIGRFGSRVLASVFKPDALIAVDVNHNYVHAPKVADKRFARLEMGKGFTLSIGAICSHQLNRYIQFGAEKENVPVQLDVVGRDTGTDAMAGVLGSIDCAAASIGIPISNMHTVSESGCTTDIDGAISGLFGTLQCFVEDGVTGDYFASEHANLSEAKLITELEPKEQEKEEKP